MIIDSGGVSKAEAIDIVFVSPIKKTDEIAIPVILMLQMLRSRLMTV